MGVVVNGIQIDSSVVSKSFPDYWEKLQSLGVIIKKYEINFNRFYGSGKFNCHQLADRLKIDMLKRIGTFCPYLGEQVFSADGEIRFREMEMEVAKKYATRKNIVVSTGGGWL
jgi:hypothetical protein